MSRGPMPADILTIDRRSDSAFWDAFVNQYWGRRPVVIRAAFPEPILDGPRAFNAVVRACDAFRARSEPTRLRVNVDGGFLLADIDDRLPNSTDVSFSGYAERLRPWLSGRPFLMTLNETHLDDVTFWKRLRACLRDLYGRVGLPSGFFMTSLWFGIYDRTPFGLHTDHSENFSLPIEGCKKMLVWPYETFDACRVYRAPSGDHLYTTRYEPWLDQATLLEGRPGDLLYWPESYWHIAISDNTSPTLTLNWAYVNKELPRGEALDIAARELVSLARDALGDKATIDNYPVDFARIHDAGRTLPEPIARARTALGSLAAGAALDDGVLAAWLCRLTSLGLRGTPRASEQILLSADDTVQGDALDPIVCVPSSSGLLIAANGLTFTVPLEPAFSTLVARLNTGKPHAVRDLEANLGISSPTIAAHVRLLLGQLVSAYAVSHRRQEK